MGSQVATGVAPVGLRALPRKQVVLTYISVLLAIFLSSLDQTVVGTAMPRIITDLGGFSQYTWVTTAYIITSAVVIPITGKLTDMFGRKPFYIFGLVLFVAASIACGLSSTMTQIIIFRGVQGIGAGVMLANAFTVIGDLFPPAERGKYQGFINALFGVSSIIGPTLGGYITDALSWHWVFFVNVPLGLVTIALFFFFFPHIRPDNLKHKVDYFGLSTLILFSVPLLLALSWGGIEYPWSSPQIIGMFIFSAVMLAFFLFVESRAAEPILPLSLFHNRIMAVSSVVVFLTGMGMFGSIIFVPLYFQGVLGATATASGNFLTPMMLGQVIGAFLSGQVLSRAGGHYGVQGAVGIVIMAFGMVLMSTMGVNTSYAEAVRNIVIMGFGLGITMPLYTIAVQNCVPYSIMGVATSTVPFFRSMGGSVGLAIFGSVMSNRFAAGLASGMPDSLKAFVPPESLSALTSNPQALLNSDAQSQLSAMFGQLGPQGNQLLEQLLQVLRQALSSALAQVFLIVLATLVVAFIVNLFIKEIPLRKHHNHDAKMD